MTPKVVALIIKNEFFNQLPHIDLVVLQNGIQEYNFIFIIVLKCLEGIKTELKK